MCVKPQTIVYLLCHIFLCYYFHFEASNFAASQIQLATVVFLSYKLPDASPKPLWKTPSPPPLRIYTYV